MPRARTAPPPLVPAADSTLSLEQLALADLHPHPRNDGRHPPDEIAHLRESIREHDIYRNVVVANDGTILAGHGVVEAARAEGKTHVPGHRRPYGPDDPRALKILVGDNHIARLRLQDDAMLTALLQELAADDPVAGLLGTGFDTDTLEALVQAQGMGDAGPGGTPGADTDAQVDRAEALREQWGVETGQLWQCGTHRVICGDCTDKAVVERLHLPTPLPLCVTSPPYPGAKMWNTEDEDGFKANISRLRTLGEDVLCTLAQNTDVICWNIADVPTGDQELYWNSFDVLTLARHHAWLVRPILWDKGIPNPLPPLAYRRKPVIPHLTHEWVLVIYSHGWKAREALSSLDDDSEFQMRSVWTIAPAHATRLDHQSPYPLELARRCVSLFSLPDDHVYDPFLGSGTTLIACQNLGRVCYGVELLPAYVGVCLERYSQHTGEQPVLLEG